MHPLDKSFQMSDDWKRWIDSHQVYNGESRFSKEMLDAMKALHDKILSFGGDEVCMTAYDEDAVKTLSRGQFFYGSSYMRKGQPSQCHANSAYLWDANRGHCSIATGYALSEDGLWRCHSWVVQPRSRTMRVWETTVKRMAYFGFVMNDTECQEFLDNNT